MVRATIIVTIIIATVLIGVVIGVGTTRAGVRSTWGGVMVSLIVRGHLDRTRKFNIDRNKSFDLARELRCAMIA